MHQKGGVGAWLTQGESSPRTFHGVDGNSRKDQGRANLEEMMIHSLQSGAIVWDELLACPGKARWPPPSHTHAPAAGCIFNREKKEKACFCQENTQGVHHMHLPQC